MLRGEGLELRKCQNNRQKICFSVNKDHQKRKLNALNGFVKIYQSKSFLSQLGRNTANERGGAEVDGSRV